MWNIKVILTFEEKVGARHFSGIYLNEKLIGKSGNKKRILRTNSTVGCQIGAISKLRAKYKKNVLVSHLFINSLSIKKIHARIHLPLWAVQVIEYRWWVNS